MCAAHGLAFKLCYFPVLAYIFSLWELSFSSLNCSWEKTFDFRPHCITAELPKWLARKQGTRERDPDLYIHMYIHNIWSQLCLDFLKMQDILKWWRALQEHAGSFLWLSSSSCWGGVVNGAFFPALISPILRQIWKVQTQNQSSWGFLLTKAIGPTVRLLIDRRTYIHQKWGENSNCNCSAGVICDQGLIWHEGHEGVQVAGSRSARTPFQWVKSPADEIRNSISILL